MRESYSVKDVIEASKKRASDLSFTSLVDDVEIYPKPKDVDFTEAKAKVFWELNMDAREYGIKDLYPTVNKITISGAYEYAVGIDEEPRVEPFEFNITGSDWHIKEDYRDTKLSEGLYPNLVQINPETKECTVEF